MSSGGRVWHTGGDIEPVDVPTNTGNHNPYIPGRTDSPGGFQAHDDNGPVILTKPAPEDVDFNDYDQAIIIMQRLHFQILDESSMPPDI